MRLVRSKWLQNAVSVLRGDHGCPFCGSTRPPYREKQQGFVERFGCLNCNTWWTPCELDGNPTCGKPRKGEAG